MTEDPKSLTPIQRALQMKQAAQAAKSGPPKAGFQGDKAAGHKSASKNKPWMKA